jgi:formate hydrogenlyase transcriptional activator
MTVPPEHALADVGVAVEAGPGTSDVTWLRRCVNDLAGILALPAMWTGHESSGVATALLDVLVRMLGLDFAYIRVAAADDGSPAEWLRLADPAAPAVGAQEVGRALAPHLTADASVTILRVGDPVGGSGTTSIAVFRLALQESLGVFVAGARRAGFPTDMDSLLLRVATNQAAIVLQEARHMSLQRRITEDLERRVAERTFELKALVDFLPQVIGVLDADGTVRYVNQAGLAYLGCTLEEIVAADGAGATPYHPEDVEAVHGAIARAFALGTSAELEARLRRHDGAYGWFLIRYQPLRNTQDRILRWYWTGLDIDDRKKSEERMREENLALREEVDKASMFEEIVGVSAPLRAVLSQVSKVATTDSTVLITGETGTGKELVARAIHKRSPRSSRAFVSVNCAAIPPALIASELFGHEKGAFTGAVQRRRGRFELADAGTIFLDEIGELPTETQVALLRVLQEREFERVGGGGPIRVNVRVIAATNRDLEAAVAEGTFRADLFYRLAVFPLEVPALRERRPDIPLLVEYFIHRYARRAAKTIRGVGEATMALLESYAWPGNIRELQNVVERAVIVCDSGVLTIDKRWLSGRAARSRATGTTPPSTPASHTKDAIEAALGESKGRVAGPFGAAVRLGVPPSTLESRIRALGIDKRRFK